MSSPDKKTVRFTDSYLKSLKPKDERYVVFDGRGLGLRVTPRGKKTFVLVYKFAGKPKMLTLGEYPAITLFEVNRKNLDAHEALARGEDPFIVFKRAKFGSVTEMTVSKLTDEFLAQHGSNLAERTRSDYRKELDRHVIPVLGDLPVRTVRRADGILLLDGMVAKGQRSAANRVAAYLSKIWSWALDRQIVEDMPFVRLKKPVVAKKRKRFLDEAEIAKFWFGLDCIKSKRTKAVLRLCLLLGRRETEVVAAKWDEFDLEGALWTIPTDRPGRKLRERNKVNEDPLIIPLPPLALEIFKERRKAQSSWGHVFPGEKDPTTHHSAGALCHALYNNRAAMNLLADPVTPHDLRRTASTHMSRIGVSQETISKVLGHKTVGVAGVYNRHDYVNERMNALLAWNNEVQRLLDAHKSALT